jgi:hypothetical protein
MSRATGAVLEVLSPLLANIFLNQAIDDWFLEINRNRFAGRCTLVRYADDMVFKAPSTEAAEELREALSNRLKAYGLELHDAKTRLLRSGRLKQKPIKQMGLKYRDSCSWVLFISGNSLALLKSLIM